MNRTVTRRMVACIYAVTLFASLPAAADDVADEAELHFDMANERFRAGDYRSALEHYLASNRLVANRNVLFNIATTYEQLKDYPNAFRFYVRANEGETDPAVRGRIETALRLLAPKVAVLRIDTEPRGARIYLNRKDLGSHGESPQRLGVRPGRYRIIAELPGYEDGILDNVDIVAGDEANLKVPLRPILATVRIGSRASGSAVHLGQVSAPVVCVAPCSVSLPPGRHVLFFTRDGYESTSVAVDLTPRGEATVDPTLAPHSGSLFVRVDESDASIDVDGQPQGPPPLALVLPTGTHRVRVSHTGFQTVEETALIRPDQRTSLSINLTPVTEVEAASRRTEKVEDAPASVTIISSQELRGLALPTVWEAVRGIRGVYLTDDRSYPTVGFRGFQRPGDYGNRVLVLLDGHPMNDNWIWSSFTSYDARTDIDDIDHIEVVRGPGSVLYGTGAFSGVINLVTRKPTKTSSEVGISVAPDAMARARGRANVQLGKDGGVWTSIAGGHSQGRDFFFPEYVAEAPPEVAGSSRGNDGADVATWTGRAWYKSLSVQWLLNMQEKMIPTAQFATIFGDNRTRQTDGRAMVEARFEPQTTGKVHPLTRAFYNYVRFIGRYPYPLDEGGIVNLRFDGMWAGLEQRLVFEVSPAVRVTLGGEGQFHFDAKQQTIWETLPELSTYTNDPFKIGALYLASDAAASERLKFSSGVRLDTYAYEGFGFSSINPRFAFIYKPYVGGNIKWLTGKAFRAPSVYELFLNGGGQVTNSELRPENIYSTEIEYSHRLSPTVSAIASVYGNYLRGLIAQRSTPTSTEENPQFQYMNTQVPVLTLGAEVELRREWKDGWMISASSSIQRSRYLNSQSVDDLVAMRRSDAFREVPNSPAILASFRAAAPIVTRALLATTRISFDAERYDRNDINDPTLPPQSKLDPSLIWDLVLSGREPRWGISYAVGAYNLFDWRGAYPVSFEFRQRTVPQAGRNFIASISAEF